MEAFVERVVRRLREEPGFSRNRHFATFSSPEGQRALRIHHHLRSIERDLGRAVSVRLERLERDDGRLRLTLRARAWLRTAFLTPAELRILWTSPLVRAALPDPGGAT